MRSPKFRTGSIPWAILVFCLAAFGILVPFLGFYWDDWPMMWFAHAFGPLGYPAAFSGDRPFLAGIYIITTAVLKTIPWQWQILGILSRWLTAVVLWWSLGHLWPNHRQQVAWVAILFAIYPGFKQQPISVVYSNGLFLLASYIASFGFMFRALQTPKRYALYTALAITSYLACTLATEYYLGLDLLRPVFIWLMIGEDALSQKQRIQKTFWHWFPYLATLIVYLIWRVAIFQFPTYKPELVGELRHNPLSVFFYLMWRIVQDIYKSGWLAWTEPFRFPVSEDFTTTASTLFWVVVFIALPLTWFYLSRLKVDNEQNAASTLWGKQELIVGVIALTVAGVPFWVTNLPLELHFPYDRFSLVFMLGGCIFIVALIDWLIKEYYQKIVILSLIISMTIGSHFENANTYRREWITQKDMFWQLTWRVPGLKPGTYLLTHALPMTYYSDNSLTAPLNWIYAPETNSPTLPYYLAFSTVRLGGSLPGYEEGLPITQRFRSTTFKGSTSEILVFFYSPPACLRVIDPKRDKDLPIFPKELAEAIPASHLSQIITTPPTPAQPPQEIFGQEPDHEWCYYFQKAELARQQGDWEEVVRLGNEAFQLGFSPSEGAELFAFIEGYAYTANWKRAIELINLAHDKNHNLQIPLCKLMLKLQNETSPTQEFLKQIREARISLDCPEQ
jgi:hypothetical protein